jgi:hypothetical protein
VTAIRRSSAPRCALALFETMAADAPGASRSLRKLAKRRAAPG